MSELIIKALNKKIESQEAVIKLLESENFELGDRIEKAALIIDHQEQELQKLRKADT